MYCDKDNREHYAIMDLDKELLETIRRALTMYHCGLYEGIQEEKRLRIKEDFQQQYAGRKEEKLDRLQCGRAGGRRGVRHSGTAAVRLCDRRGVRQKSLQRGSGLPRYGNLQTGRYFIKHKSNCGSSVAA